MKKKSRKWLLSLFTGVISAIISAVISAVILAIFYNWAFQHPLRALGILLLCALVGGLVGVLGIIPVRVSMQVWPRIERRLVGWLDLRVRWLFPRYDKHYHQYLVSWHSSLDVVKGTSLRGSSALQVEDVFVELSIDPRVPDQVSQNPFPQELQEGRHPIWEYLASGSQHLVILGPLGTGKTALLQYIAMTLIDDQKRRQMQVPPKLPILLFLREHVQAITANPKLSLAALVHKHLKKRGYKAPKGWFKHQLKRGRCLVLLDGLDDVADLGAREKVVRWIERQSRSSYGQSCFLVTSRPFGFQKTWFDKWPILLVRPFTNEQIEQYVRKWYTINKTESARRDDSGVRAPEKKDAESFLERLRKAPELLELAVNPLLLYMMVTVHHYHYEGTLPGTQVKLYAEACKVFLGSWQEAKDTPLKLQSAQIQAVLQPLAYHLLCTQKHEVSLDEAIGIIAKSLKQIYKQMPAADTAEPVAQAHKQMSPADFLAMVEGRCGLLLKRESGDYGFALPTFREYLAAVHIKEQRLEKELLGRVSEDRWHETIKFYAAQADATAIIEACLDTQPLTANALSLAFECYEEAQQPLAVRPRIRELREWGVEATDPELRSIVAEAVLTRRLRRQMTPLDQHRSMANSLITCAEYQLFVDEQRSRTRWLQPDQWATERFEAGKGNDPVLGVRPPDAADFCTWLNERKLGAWHYRLPHADELVAKRLDKELLRELEQGKGYWSDTGKFIQSGATSSAHLLTVEMLNEQVSKDLTRAGTYTLPLKFSRDRARDLVRARTRALGHALALDRPHALTHARALALDLNPPLTLDLVRPLAVALVNPLTSCRALDLNVGLALPLAHALAGALALDSGRDRPFTDTLTQNMTTWKDAAQVLRWLIRLSALVIADHLLGKGGRRQKTEVRQAADAYLDLYIDFAMLEARIEERLQPFEGILIIKERKQSTL